MSDILVLHYKLQEKFKTIHSINWKYLLIHVCPLETRPRNKMFMLNFPCLILE